MGISELALAEALVSSQAALLSTPTCFQVNGQTTFPGVVHLKDPSHAIKHH